MKLLRYNDPLYHCELYKQIGCVHLDGMMCDLNNCYDLEDYKAEKLAKRFHELYERFAPEYDYKTRECSNVPWVDVPRKQLMIRVCKEILKGN